MSTGNDQVVRYDTNDPEDLQHVLDNGMVWSGGQRALQDLLKGLRAGTVTLTPAAMTKLQPWSRDMLTTAGIAFPAQENA